MGSLTVRNIGEHVKQRLRIRAAANGRSMEEEVRLLLAEGAVEAAPAKPSTGKSHTPARSGGSAPASSSSSPAGSRPTSRST